MGGRGGGEVEGSRLTGRSRGGGRGNADGARWGGRGGRGPHGSYPVTGRHITHTGWG